MIVNAEINIILPSKFIADHSLRWVLYISWFLPYGALFWLFALTTVEGSLPLAKSS